MTLSRRRFLKGAVAGGTLLPLVTLQTNCGLIQPAPYVDAVIGSDGKIVLDIGSYPDLIPVGGAITLRFNLPPDTPYHVARAGVLVIHRAAEADQLANLPYLVTQSACPHAGCPLGFNPASNLIECPCHASKFRTAIPDDLAGCRGEVVHPPANQDLVVFAADYSSDAQTLTINLNKVVSCGGATPFPDAAGGKVVLGFSDFPELMNPGGSSVGQPGGWPDTLIVFRVDATTVRALSAVCTHLNCSVGYDPSKDRIECPCHGSVFTDGGAVVTGPAKDPLKTYSAMLNANDITVTLA